MTHWMVPDSVVEAVAVAVPALAGAVEAIAVAVSALAGAVEAVA